MSYERFIKEHGYNAVVTCGGMHSNHNRAIALMAMANGWKCHLVYHGSEHKFKRSRGNADLVRMSGASYEFVSVPDIAVAMDKSMEAFTKEGLKPYYIHGGGHDLPGGIAFVEAIKELKSQCDSIAYKPNYIFVATGTGSMQAGMVVGLDLVGWSDVHLVGLSIARKERRGKKIVVDFANNLSKHYRQEKDYTDAIIFNTDYIGRGYGQTASKQECLFIRDVRINNGLLLDRTYTGKAMYGMIDFIKKNKIKGNILFWFTGGPLNAQI